MKKLLFILLFTPLISFGQDYTNRDGVLLNEINSKYIIVSKPQVYNKKPMLVLIMVKN